VLLSIEFDDVLNSVAGTYNSVFGILTDFNTAAHGDRDDLGRLASAYDTSPDSVKKIFANIPFIILNKLSGMGEILEQTTFYNCRVLNVTQNDLDYYQNGISRVTGLFSYNYFLTQAAGVAYGDQEIAVGGEQRSSYPEKFDLKFNADSEQSARKENTEYTTAVWENNPAEVFTPKVAINTYQARP
jgi:hypothetical protein